MPWRAASASMSREHGVARLAVDEAGEEDVLQAEVVGEARLEAGGRVGLAAARDVGEMLVVGVEAQVLDAGVAVDDVAGADDLVLRQLRVAVDAEVGAEGDLEADVARGLPVVPDEVVDGGDARGDGAGGEALVDHPAADLGDAAEEHGLRGRERARPRGRPPSRRRRGARRRAPRAATRRPWRRWLRPPAHQAASPMLMPMRAGSWFRARSPRSRPLLLLEPAGIGALVEILGVGDGEVVAADSARPRGRRRGPRGSAASCRTGSSSGRADRGRPPGRG